MKANSQRLNSSNNQKRAAGKNQASAKTIIQAYKNSDQPQRTQAIQNNNATSIQLRAYAQTFTVKEDIADGDKNDWNVMRRKLGIPKKGSAAGSAAENAKASLAALGLSGTDTPMTAHMIPRRTGGMGNSTNARPWADKFENGTWKKSVDDVFDDEFKNKKKNDTVIYSVETTDMDDGFYDTIKAKSAAADSIKNSAAHKANIQEIPLSVKATVGSKSLANTDECRKNLIKP